MGPCSGRLSLKEPETRLGKTHGRFVHVGTGTYPAQVGGTISRERQKEMTMLIEIHAIQNHSPANLNRDDLGAPKTCYFGGVLRSRISSQSIKRSIRMSREFEQLLGGVRTRQLARLIADNLTGAPKVKE